MKTRIIRMAIGLTALVVSFLPQQAQAAVCSEECEKTVTLPDGSQAIVRSYCEIEAPKCSAECVDGIATCLA